jgi:hypothetical protein
VVRTVDVAAVQSALDALVTGDRKVAASWYADALVLTGIGGLLDGRIVGLSEVIDRFAQISGRTGGTFGTEVEAVFVGDTPQVVVLARHWAALEGREVRGTQALLLTIDGERIEAIMALSPTARPRSGIWD